MLKLQAMLRDMPQRVAQVLGGVRHPRNQHIGPAFDVATQIIDGLSGILVLLYERRRDLLLEIVTEALKKRFVPCEGVGWRIIACLGCRGFWVVLERFREYRGYVRIGDIVGLGSPLGCEGILDTLGVTGDRHSEHGSTWGESRCGHQWRSSSQLRRSASCLAIMRWDARARRAARFSILPRHSARLYSSKRRMSRRLCPKSRRT